MELSLEAYRTIIKNVQSRSDLATLCLVSRSFRRVAERALYNTLYMREVDMTKKLCDALVGQPRVADWVEALTIAVEEDDGGQEEEEEEEEYDETEEDDQVDQDFRMDMAAAVALSLQNVVEDSGAPVASTSARPEPQENLWPVISRALQNMTRLRHLNILVNGSPSSSYSYSGDGSLGWILANFFHTDMRWDEDLVKFLNSQVEIEDLFIGDYEEGEEEQEQDAAGQIEEVLREEDEAGPGDTIPLPASQSQIISAPSRSRPRPELLLSPSALPHLTTLECTFSEAAVALVPSRPVSRLKTCFSRTDPVGKREEMKILFEALGKASPTIKPAASTTSSRSGGNTRSGREGRVAGGWRALDIADADYHEDFAMELLRAVVNVTLIVPRTRLGVGSGLSMKGTLRYLGTLVLPVGGNERLLFYALLMQFRRLCCVELEVSAWSPSPTTLGPVAFRALANELRLYCPGVSKVVFVAMGGDDGNGGSGSSNGMGIGERTTVEYVVGEGVGRVEREVMNGSGSEGFWRDV
ncbi:hypothetical protein BT96DRAFT_976929 [Gymnopus androsaceus JB14]|uniref:F-box domain-containing protein n=1 Tax=Gymnopus androsaceus JB14 TaxID=1447944 RepID=A0A6A4HHR2_9AGAR|nr:hypothetical protein BT96DRAFT_976929 [Gymnopus androsaceus JB14]